MKHTASWISWLVFSLGLILSTGNPFYLSIQMVCLLILGSYLAKRNNHPAWLAQNFRLLLFMLLVSSLVNVLFTHTGSTILFKFPDDWILIGGNITLESLVYGLTNGLIIGSIFIAFNILNLALSIRQLTRLIPGALRPIAMTVTVTLTFFPSFQQRAKEIKEAQLIRGNQMKKIRDWLPLLLPLLISSLENAISLSESMASRGFEAKASTRNTKITVISLLLATFIIFSAWVLSLFEYPLSLTLLLYAAGGSLLFVVLILTTRKLHITHYRKEIWLLKDILSSCFFITAIISLIILFQFNLLTPFSYSPYPGLTIPDISIPGLLISTLPLMPILIGKND